MSGREDRGWVRCDSERCDHPDGWHFTLGELVGILALIAAICWIASIS